MNYLITGGAGFIGSHLAESLISDGHNVAVIDDLSTGSLKNLTALFGCNRFRFAEGSILNSVDIGGLVSWADTVFHLAAAVGVDLVVRDPVRTIETNVHGSENIFHAAGLSKTKVVLASTSEVYGRAEKECFAETDDLVIGPPTHYRWSYAASKALDEFLALSYYKEGRLNPIIVRLFNTVGPRQTGRYGMVLPRFVERALKGEPVEVYGDGTQTRCFCHVKDTVRALMALEQHEKSVGEIFNIGTSHSISIRQLAELVIEATGSTSTIRFVPYEEAYEPGFEDMQRRMPDTTKLHTFTGWEPEYQLADIIAEVGDYIEANG